MAPFENSVNLNLPTKTNIHPLNFGNHHHAIQNKQNDQDDA